MCRFIAYSGSNTTMSPLVFEADNSLISQSKAAKKRKNPVNADGFGVGWYTNHNDPEPALFANVDPAWSNRNLRMIATKIQTEHYFAHVRDASPNMPVSLANCHPFAKGKYLWMHNGRLDQFEKIRREILLSLSKKSFSMIQGNTDSEHAFALYMDILGHKENASQDDIAQAMEETILRIMKIRKDNDAHTCAFMNFAVTDGYNMIITRFGTCRETQPSSLFWGYGHVLNEDGNIRFDDIKTTDQKSVVICSEDLTKDKGNWHKVDRNHILIANKDQGVICRPLNIPYQEDL